MLSIYLLYKKAQVHRGSLIDSASAEIGKTDVIASLQWWGRQYHCPLV